tara:strand:+ start:301 stop:696 length:396 start_codon:yes stop_codon:yes gene_type:complete
MPSFLNTLIIVKKFNNFQNMQQLELFDYRKDFLFDRRNQIAHFYDILSETKDTISYAEHIDPNKGFAVAQMEYEEYVDIKKEKLGVLTYDEILNYLKSSKKENRLEKLKALLEFKNIPFEADLFTWHNDDL